MMRLAREESYSYRKKDSLLFLVQVGEGEGRERGEKGKGGRRPSLLVQFGLGGEGARGLPWPALLFSLRAHVGPITSGGFR